MKYHSEGIDEPVVTLTKCDGCGEIYEELATVVWARHNAIISKIYCIECDDESTHIIFINALEDMSLS